MNDPSPAPESEYPPGIVCSRCGRSEWETTRTQKSVRVVRRWRTCLTCGHRVRTAERVEADTHPERDAA